MEECNRHWTHQPTFEDFTWEDEIYHPTKTWRKPSHLSAFVRQRHPPSPTTKKGTRFWSVGGSGGDFLFHPNFCGKVGFLTCMAPATFTYYNYYMDTYTEKIGVQKTWGGYENEVISPCWPPPIGHPLVVESEVRAAESQISSGSKSWRSIRFRRSTCQ